MKMKKIISMSILILMMVSVADSWAVPFGRSRLPCAARNAKDCPGIATYQQDQKDGCAKITSNCIKYFCSKNCTSTGCDKDLCADCKSVFLDGPNGNEVLACRADAVRSRDDSVKASYEEEEDPRSRKLRQQSMRVRADNFGQDLRDYEAKMKEFNYVAARYREAQRLLKKYGNKYLELQKETNRMNTSLIDSYGRDQVMRNRIQKVKEDYIIDVEAKDEDLNTPASRNPRKLRNFARTVGRRFEQATGPGYDKDTQWQTSDATEPPF